jgi:hypothetical protein
MAWNHRSRVVAMSIAIQVGAGTFIQPNTTTDIMAVSSPTNTHDAITADDATATGTVWESNRVYLGKTATIGATVPLRGPGGAAPPALNGWTPGRVLQSAGFSEVRKAALNTSAIVAGSTTTVMNLAATESAVDDFLLGAPVQHANVGSGFRATTFITDYNGTTKGATIGETLAVAPVAASSYTIPAYLSYTLGTLALQTIYLSGSIWRDKKRYDYRDFQPASVAFTMPVANEANTSFPDMTFSGKALVQAVVDDFTPVVPIALLNVPVPPCRDGKFYLDRVKLGHQQVTFTINLTVSGASNQNQAAGQDAYDPISGNRAIQLDLNQMAVADFDLTAREDAQTVMPMMSTWGLGAGNRFGFIVPNLVLDPFSPGDRNGYVSLTGNAYTTDVDKSAALTIWW